MKMESLSRRRFLHVAATVTGGAMLAACQPQVVEKIVKETVVVTQEKVVEKEVEKEVTKVVEKVVEKVVQVEKEQPVVRFASQPSGDSYADQMKALNDFMGETGIRVEFEPVPGDWSSITERMLAGFAAGDAPDVFRQYGPHVRMVIDKKIVLSYSPFVDAENYDLSDFVEGQILAGSKGSEMYGMPDYCGIWSTWYNKDLFDEAGVPVPDKNTWDLEKYVEAAVKLTKRDDNGDLLQAGAELNTALEFGLSTAVWSFGAEVADPKDLRICKLSDPLAMDALQWMADLKWKYEVTPSAAESSAMNTAGGWGIFPSGKAGMRDDGTWFFCCNMDAVADKFEYGIAPHWAGPKGQRATFCTTDLWLTNRNTKYPDACWEFNKFNSGPIMARIKMIHNHLQPAIKSMAPEWIDVTKEYAVRLNPKAANLDLSACVEAYEYARPMFWFECHTAAMEILNPVLDQIYTTGSGTVQQLIPEVCAKISQIEC